MRFVRVRGMFIAALFGVLAPALAPHASSAQDDPTRSSDTQAEIARMEEMKARLRELEAKAEEKANDAEYFFDLGNIYADLSRNHDASEAYTSALSIDPDYLQALVNFGSLMNQLGDLDKAIELLSHAVEVAPNEPKAFVNLGNAYYSKGEYFLAMEQYRAAKAADENAFEADYQIGVAFADAGIYREALNWWQLVVDGAPDTEAAKAAAQNIEVVEKILARRQ